MRALSKKVQIPARDRLVAVVEAAEETLELRIDEYNADRKDAWEAYDELRERATKLEAEDGDATSVHEAAEGILNAFNDTIDEHMDLVGEALDALNEALSALRDYRDEIVGEMRAYMDAKSERWAESEAGENYATWVSAWEEADLEDLDMSERPADLEGDETSYINGLLDETLGQSLGFADLPEAP